MVKLRVAFPVLGGENWAGGYNYLVNLLRVIDEEASDKISPIVLAAEDCSEANLSPFRKIKSCVVVRTAIFDRGNRSRLLFRSLAFGVDGAMEALIKQEKIDLIFESASFFGWRITVPTIAWMPDFQHRYLPNHFSLSAWWRRELGFRAQILSGRTLMVSSVDSLNACNKFYSNVRGGIKTVRFAVHAPIELSDSQARIVADRYNLPEHYFFMPNQFWSHKNHMLVIRALEILKGRGTHVTVLATGKQLDPRNPFYVPSVVKAVENANLQSQFIMPGLVPSDDMVALRQASAALLNPSLFEGWSTSVEEARSAGVPMLLSDLAVHREQAGNDAIYFSRYSPDELAKCLFEFVPLSSVERSILRKKAAISAQFRIRRFADDFLDTLLFAAEIKNTKNLFR